MRIKAIFTLDDRSGTRSDPKYVINCLARDRCQQQACVQRHKGSCHRDVQGLGNGFCRARSQGSLPMPWCCRYPLSKVRLNLYLYLVYCTNYNIVQMKVAQKMKISL